VSDSSPRQPAGLTLITLHWLVVALMVLAIIYALAMVIRNWSHISV
jgi:hypothetical protein